MGSGCGTSHRSDRGLRYLAQGTALVGGKLVGAYVTYFDHKYSLSPLRPAGQRVLDERPHCRWARR